MRAKSMVNLSRLSTEELTALLASVKEEEAKRDVLSASNEKVKAVIKSLEEVAKTLKVKEFDLLCALMRANGRVLNRDQILETVWGYSNAVDIESRTVDVHIRRLREKLGNEYTRIVTVKGVGYRFEAGAI